jgi:hypothetical protein
LDEKSSAFDSSLAQQSCASKLVEGKLGNQRGHAWAAVIEATLAASRTETTST